MKISIKNLLTKLTGLAFATAFTLSASAGVIKTDIIFVIDESGSMGGAQANLINNIGIFANILSGGNVDAMFGLVGYGRTSGSGGPGPQTLSALTDATTFASNAASLIASGSTEPAYDAIAYSLNNPNGYNSGGSFAFRNDAVTNIILVTDEDSDQRSNSATWVDVDAMLKAASALFNLVSNTTARDSRIGGDGTNLQTLGTLATQNGGQWFNFSELSSSNSAVVQSFVEAFANAKLQETIDFCTANPNDPACVFTQVPEPKGLVALALGIFLLRRLARK